MAKLAKFISASLFDLKRSVVVYPDQAFQKLDGLSGLPKAAAADLRGLDGKNHFEVFRGDLKGQKKDFFFAVVSAKTIGPLVHSGHTAKRGNFAVSSRTSRCGTRRTDRFMGWLTVGSIVPHQNRRMPDHTSESSKIRVGFKNPEVS